jgi:hypothetical protein
LALALERYAHLASAALIVAGPIILLSLIAVGIVYVRLSHGPVSLKAFSSSIEQGISAELGDFTARIDDAVLALTASRGLEIQLVNLRISEPDGDLVASAPLAAVELSHSALFMLRAVPESVLLLEPKVSFRYTEAGGLTLSISNPTQTAEGAPPAPASNAPPAPQEKDAATTTQAKTPPAGDLNEPFHRIDLARALAEASARARRSGNAASKLREIGVRNATVVLEYAGKTSELNLAEATIDLEHRSRRSVMTGSATVATPRGPWTLSFRSEDSEKGNFIKVTTSVRDLVPSTLAKTSPQMSLLETLDMPIGGDLALELSTSGELKEATLALDLSRGRIGLPSMSGTPLVLDAGQIKLSYDAAARRLDVAPSTLTWGDSHMTIEGAMTSETAPGGEPQWRFGLKAKEGLLAAEEFGVAGIKVDTWLAAGRIIPGAGLVQLTEFTLKAGGAEVSVNGEITTGSEVPSTRVEAAMSPMTLPTLKALWPRALAPAARTWVGKHVTSGNLRSGKFKLLSGKFLDREGAEMSAEDRKGRLSMSIEVSDLKMVPLPHGLPIEAPRALIHLEGNTLEVTIPDAAVIAGPSSALPVKGGRFTVTDVGTAVPIGELAFRTQTSLATVLEAIKSSQFVSGAAPDLPAGAIDGKVDGQFKITVPLVESPNAPPATAEGKARFSEIRTKQPLGRLDIQGGTIDVNVAQTAVIASGELIVNGVLAKLDMQRIFDAPPEMQPPLRLSATLDNSDRTQIGLDVNHLVQGDVPFEITVLQGAGNQPAIHARADLTNAELSFQDLAWRKPPGRNASLEFDVATGATQNIELKNFKISGDDIAIEGWLSIDNENEVREFFFPNFSLNVVSRLEVQGKISPDKIWSIKAHGSTYDAKDLFRSLLSLGQSDDAEIKPLRPANGIELEAAIDTVLGHSEVSMRTFKLKLAKRHDILSALDAQGTLDGGKPLSVVLRKDAGARIVNAESPDAGQAFKLIGFYPNLQGGRLRLELNLDAKGAADKSGTLMVDDFRVLGDPIISEVYSSASASGPAIDTAPQGQRRVVREVFEFDRMKVPFSVGHGQFVLEESYVKGPIIGASIRGKVDYTSQRVNLGGTYVPLQGINSALCDIPLFGPIVAGLECEGVFGITYAIQGPMSEPQVIVNPLSMFTPGILRGIMEMTNPNPKVLPREEKPKPAAEKRVRASSSSPTAGDTEKAGASRAGTIDGWSSETKPGAPAKK